MKPETQVHYENLPEREDLTRGFRSVSGGTAGPGLCFRGVLEGPRKAPVRHCLFEFFWAASNSWLLPIELFVEKEDQEIDIDFSSIK